MTTKEPKTIKTVDTGDIWECPCCHKQFHLLHREQSNGKILKHDFEEVIK